MGVHAPSQPGETSRLHDVLVVGAGPAGNNAAFRLASLGYDVVVVDRCQSIGDKLCTGIVGAECLRRYPAKESQVLNLASSAIVTGPSGASLTVAHDDTQAYVLNRVSYVAGFAEKARHAGADYLLGHSVRDLIIEPGGVRALAVNGGEPKTLQARAAVLATGFGSRFTQSVGLGQVNDYAVGVQAEVSAPAVSNIEVHLGKKLAPGFFAWLVPTSGGKALLGLLGRKRPGMLFNALLARFLQTGKVEAVTKQPRRWGIPLTPLKRTYRDRLLAVGDAAGQVKPATGGGIYYGLRASDLAAETLDEAFQQGDLSASALGRYEERWTEFLGDEMRVALNARRILGRLGDRQIDYLVDALSSSGQAEEVFQGSGVSFDWPSTVIKRLLLTPVLRRFGPLASLLGLSA